MSMAKIAISVDQELLEKIDGFVRQHVFKNRSQAIQSALTDSLKKLETEQFYTECAKLDPTFERQLAEEGLSLDTEEW